MHVRCACFLAKSKHHQGKPDLIVTHVQLWLIGSDKTNLQGSIWNCEQGVSWYDHDKKQPLFSS